jgi:phosphoenolpyruvate carboxylase
MPQAQTPVDEDKDRPLRDNIRLLGRILGDTVREQGGEAVFDTVERIRRSSVRFRATRMSSPGAVGALDLQSLPLSRSAQSPSDRAAEALSCREYGRRECSYRHSSDDHGLAAGLRNSG